MSAELGARLSSEWGSRGRAAFASLDEMLEPEVLAVDPNTGSVYFLDWARPALAPPAIDLAYWLFTANGGSPGPRQDLSRSYAATLERQLGTRFSSAEWEPQLDLCVVAFVAAFAPIIANTGSDAAVGWGERCRPGLRALR